MYRNKLHCILTVPNVIRAALSHPLYLWGTYQTTFGTELPQADSVTRTSELPHQTLSANVLRTRMIFSVFTPGDKY